MCVDVDTTLHTHHHTKTLTATIPSRRSTSTFLINHGGWFCVYDGVTVTVTKNLENSPLYSLKKRTTTVQRQLFFTKKDFPRKRENPNRLTYINVTSYMYMCISVVKSRNLHGIRSRKTSNEIKGNYSLTLVVA